MDDICDSVPTVESAQFKGEFKVKEWLSKETLQETHHQRKVRVSSGWVNVHRYKVNVVDM